MAKTRKIGRSAITGRFTPVSVARRKRRTHVVETVRTRRSPKRRRRKGR